MKHDRSDQSNRLGVCCADRDDAGNGYSDGVGDMTTDIVERLRRLPPSPIAFGDSEANKRNRAERGEAADEIERLRLVEASLVKIGLETEKKLEAEIERLRASINSGPLVQGEPR